MVAVGAKSLIAFLLAGLLPHATTLSIPVIPDASATVSTASKASRFFRLSIFEEIPIHRKTRGVAERSAGDFQKSTLTWYVREAWRKDPDGFRIGGAAGGSSAWF